MGILDIFKSNSGEVTQSDNVALEAINKAKNTHLKDAIAPAAIGIESKGLVLGGLRTRSYFIMSYPRYLNDNWFSPIVNLE